ncbi:hypothetical protein P8452_46182 [Trifolium repens]|nr:hypothetical protein P8452_46182 [Trifolium repens]
MFKWFACTNEATLSWTRRQHQSPNDEEVDTGDETSLLLTIRYGHAEPTKRKSNQLIVLMKSTKREVILNPISSNEEICF